MPLAENSYGKSGVRVVKVVRGKDRHELKDLTVAIALEGDFVHAHTTGENADVLPTDTMRNTVYVFAKRHDLHAIEDFGVALARHFLETSAAAARVRIHIVEHLWARIEGQLAP